jgi:hypothetical protein
VPPRSSPRYDSGASTPRANAAGVGAARSAQSHAAAATAAAPKGAVPAMTSVKSPATAAANDAAAAVAAGRLVVAEVHIDQRDDGDDGLARIIAAAAVGTRNEQSAAQAGAAAGERAAGPTLGFHVLQGQILDRDVARIDKEAAEIGTVDGLDLRAAAAVRSLDGQRRAALQVDRRKLRSERDRAVDINDVVVGENVSVDKCDRVGERASAAYSKCRHHVSPSERLVFKAVFCSSPRTQPEMLMLWL